MELKLLLMEQKKTENTVRFEELERPGRKLALRYIYVQKAALAQLGNPQMIEVTVQAIKDEDLG